MNKFINGSDHGVELYEEGKVKSTPVLSVDYPPSKTKPTIQSPTLAF